MAAGSAASKIPTIARVTIIRTGLRDGSAGLAAGSPETKPTKKIVHRTGPRMALRIRFSKGRELRAIARLRNRS